MAIINIDQLFTRINERLGENNDDETLSLIADMHDTVNDLSERSKDNTNWKEKYDNLDNEWRKKYRDRFFNASAEDDEDEEEEIEKPKALTFEELFNKGE